MHDDALREFFEREDAAVDADPTWPDAHAALLDALEAGRVRAAERDPDGAWRPVAWVKRAILTGFRRSATVPMEAASATPFFDRAAFPARAFAAGDGVRLVPGGTAVRRGARVAPGVVVMPPAYVNVGAWVGAGTMVDSHALVGSCAQVGERVHLSAGRSSAACSNRCTPAPSWWRTMRSSVRWSGCSKAWSCGSAPYSPPASC